MHLGNEIRVELTFKPEAHQSGKMQLPLNMSYYVELNDETNSRPSMLRFLYQISGDT